MKEYNLFFSWQSDDKHTRNVIKSKIKDACDYLKSMNIGVRIIEDSRTENGAEHIDTGLLQSIDNSDLFIADVTPVFSYESDGKVKLSPNGNVLFEAGYAIARLGDGRCRFIARLEKNQDFHELPFDINHRKLLKFSDSNKAALKEIKDWILSKISIIDEQREVDELAENAEILCVDTTLPELEYTKELTLHPNFKKITYIQPRVKRTQPCRDALQSVVLGKADAFPAMLDNYWKKTGIQLVKPSFVKPITRETNENLVPLQLIIENNGQTQLRDLVIQIWCDNEDVSFYYTPVTDRLQMPTIRKETDLFIYEDGRHMGMRIPKLNATETQVLDDIYQVAFQRIRY